MDFMFFLESALLGVGLAMDAFSVSMANGLNEPDMQRRKLLLIAGTFGFFQVLMPVIGWICVHYVYETFSQFQKFVPYIALLLLLYIGGKMLLDGIRHNEESGSTAVDFRGLMLQGVATSIDALSVGFTIADYGTAEALISSAVIGIVTFFICVPGVLIGRKFGTKLANKAAILGGSILVLIGLKVFLEGIGIL